MNLAWRQRLVEPVDAASLAAFRFLLGITLGIGCLRFMLEGWVEPFYVAPSFFFKYPGFSWVVVPDAPVVYALYSISALTAFSFALGAFYRLSAAIFFFSFGYLQLLDVSNYLNHYVLALLLVAIMFFIPAHRVASIDAWRTSRRNPLKVPANTVALFSIWLLRFQFAVVYFFAAIAKMNSEWLVHGQPMGIWLHARDELPLLGQFFTLPHVPLVMSWAGMLYDLTIVLWLLHRRSRPFAFIVVLVFHGMTSLLFNIGLFPFIMSAGATLFFSASWPRLLLIKAPPLLQVKTPKPISRYVLAACSVLLILEVAIPARALFYPGSTNWSEEGMRFSWRVMTREKNGSVQYRVVAPSLNKAWSVSSHRYLTWRQANEMSGQPDLIVQLGQHIGEEFKNKGHTDVMVFVETQTSLNGLAPLPLINPQQNLLEVQWGVGHASWLHDGPSRSSEKLRQSSAL